MIRPSALIVGSTSSLGQALARDYAKRGYRLILAARDCAHQSEIAADLRIRLEADVLECRYDASEPETFVGIAAIYRDLAPCRILFVAGAVGEPDRDLADPAAVRLMTEANYSGLAGAMAACLAVAPLAPGTCVGFIGSVAGDRGRAVSPLYCGAKAALNAYAQALRQRWRASGVNVTLIRLGYVDSRLSYGLTPPRLTVSPEYAARKIARAVDRGRSIVYVPGWWRLVMAVIRCLPEWLWVRLPHF